MPESFESPESPESADIPASDVLASIFSAAGAGERVVTVHGYGIKMTVRNGHLVISDGIGRQRRERRYPKVDRSIRRIVITAPDGYITLDALQWCADHGITVITLDPDGNLIACQAVNGKPAEAKLLRRQAIASGTETGVSVARELISRKIRGQSANLLKLFNDANAAAIVEHYATRLEATGSTAEIEDLEAWAARDYFATWSGRVSIPWRPGDHQRIPSNWLTYPGRTSTMSGRAHKRLAFDPVNAMLNYAYTIGYAECRTACIMHGLHPALGFMHADRQARDSLALDILETVRPEIDVYVLGLLGIGSESRKFTYRDFSEPYDYPPGTCRINAPLTHQIAEQSWTWRKTASESATEVVNILNGSAGKRGTAMANWKIHRDKFTTATVTVDGIISDETWDRLFAPIVPVKPRGKGHPPIDSRILIAAMIHCDRNRRPWAHVPESFGIGYRTMTERRREWQRSGDWPPIAAAIEGLARIPG
jgi:CRISPR-associated endonuclease Cas1